MTFLARLAAASRARDSVICVGLDPDPNAVPSSCGAGPQGALTFLRAIIRATSEYVSAYKPNLAFYERYGTAAFELLAAVRDAVPADIPVILDAKRGDVPNTAAAYADALFDSLRADAVTVSPYVGLDAIAPFCLEDRFAFVLARTSNPGAADFQDLDVGGRPLYEQVVASCVRSVGKEQLGFVVGATYPQESRRLRVLAPDRLFLLPGVGAQGGDLSLAMQAALDAGGGGVLPSASRSVLYASGPHGFERNAADAARALRDEANAVRAASVTR